jgi:hypothetical protein
MYTLIERRTFDPDRIGETRKLAEKDFFPKLREAPGFVSFNLVNDADNAVNLAVFTWDSQAQADTFLAANGKWRDTLTSMGNVLQGENHGESMVQLQPLAVAAKG